jgi:hypothetical protein
LFLLSVDEPHVLPDEFGGILQLSLSLETFMAIDAYLQIDGIKLLDEGVLQRP